MSRPAKSLLILLLLAAPPVLAERLRANLNQDWRHLPWDAPGASRADFDDSAWRPVQLPYSELARGEPEAVHWYRKSFTLPPSSRGRQVLLEFEAVAIQCQVWVNGQPAGEHLGAFTTFVLDVTKHLNPPGKPNSLAVRVDFAPSWRYRIPFLPEGYNDWGGIYRDVWLIQTDPLHIQNVFVATPDLSAARGTVRVQAEIMNLSATRRSARLRSVVYDAAQEEVRRIETPFDLAPGEGRALIQESDPVEQPRLWSPASPYLYTVVTSIVQEQQTLDHVVNPLGFRWFRFDPDKGFFLNGESLKLRGANMHQGYPYAGNAVPNSKMAFDLHVLKAMGCNWLRTTHIAMDPVVLEMADRLGFLVWEEIPVAGFGNGRMGDPFYDEAARQQMREMIRRDRNHPSIILWATMNEAAGGESRQRLPATLSLCRDLEAIAKREDPTRLTSIAETIESFFDVNDVSGRNAYFRGPTLYRLGEYLDNLKREHPQGRFLITEYGAPNVERGNFGPGRTDTEEYAALAHEHNLREHDRRPWIAGSTIWNAFDYFHGEPHEGVADEARYPKDAWYFYQSRWSGQPMLRIRSSAHWNFSLTDAADRRAGPAVDVAVDSNCDTVELFLNGVSQGVREAPGPFVWRQLVFQPGTLRAVGRKAGAVLEHTRSTPGPPERVVLRADVAELAADGRDLAYLKAYVVDSEGRTVGNFTGAVQFTVEGEGDLLGPASQRVLAGVATLASVRSRTAPGEIRVTARVGRLKPSKLSIPTTNARSSVDYE